MGKIKKFILPALIAVTAVILSILFVIYFNNKSRLSGDKVDLKAVNNFGTLELKPGINQFVVIHEKTKNLYTPAIVVENFNNDETGKNKPVIDNAVLSTNFEMEGVSSKKIKLYATQTFYVDNIALDVYWIKNNYKETMTGALTVKNGKMLKNVMVARLSNDASEKWGTGTIDECLYETLETINKKDALDAIETLNKTTNGIEENKEKK